MTNRAIRIVSRNIARRRDPWFELAEMARRGEADLALLQETGEPPGEIADQFRYENDALEPSLVGRWPLVVQLSDRVVSSGSGRFLRRDGTASGKSA